MKNKAYMVITTILVLCMVCIDFSMSIKYDPATAPDGEKYDSIITEKHEMGSALADGTYNERNSDIAKPEGEILDVEVEDEEEEEPLEFNILEILPTEKKGVVGFTIGGCEPFTDESGDPISGLKYEDTGEYIATPEQMREAYMDAILNPNPGSDGGADQNILNNQALAFCVKTINSKMAECGSPAPFTILTESWWPERYEAKYKGYYKYVGHNKGFFSLESKNNNNAVMRSKFYYDSDDNDYIFVYSDDRSADKNDINVEGHKRIKYTNNDIFLKDYLEVEDVKKWKSEHKTEVVTRTPISVSVEDIEKADVIFLNGGEDMDYYRYALELNNRLHDRDVRTDSDKKYSSSLDFDEFEKVIKIYEKIAVKQDAAIIVSKECSATANNGVDTNIHKLICMLFYATKEYDSTPGAGRDVFMNFLKRYVDEPGEEYMGYRLEYEKHKVHAKDKNSGELLYDGDGDPVYEADPRYADFRAPSIRHKNYYKVYNFYDEAYATYANIDNYNDNIKIPYHHYYKFNPGHPLVLNKEDAITGGHYVNGHLEAEKDISQVIPRKMIRSNPQMYIDAGMSEREKDSTGNYIQDDSGYYYETAGNGNRPWCVDAYQSMSNTTDYVYIDENTGQMVRTDKYSGCWFNMDMDDTNDGNAYKKITWYEDKFSVWPWGYEKQRGGAVADSGRVYDNYPDEIWFYNISTTGKDDGFTGDLHLWFDYVVYPKDWVPFGQIRMIKEISGSVNYNNQSIAIENSIFKDNWIKDAVNSRKCKRELPENSNDNHTTKTIQRDYHISMNILNGDGFNDKLPLGENNKIIYYNEYEVKYDEDGKVTEPDIPLLIKVKSSCPIVSISVVDEDKGPIAIYTFNYNVDRAETIITGTCSDSEKLELKLKSTSEDGSAKEETQGFKLPIYTFEGEISGNVIKDSEFYNKRNTKLSVVMKTILPDGKETPKEVTDNITIVRRDFFMLN